jgi:hypothetical protein
MSKRKHKFVVVWESEYNVKEPYTTTKIGDTIKEILKDNGLVSEFPLDYYKLNSDVPTDMGTFGEVFYDIYVFYATEGKIYGEDYELTEEEQDNTAGRIMIFLVD